MTIVDLWRSFQTERSISVAETSLVTDYRQVGNWLERCPIQDVEQGRAALIWVLQQKPEKAARRVAMYLKTLYRWAASEEVALVAKNPIATFKFPKAPQTPEPTVIPTEVVGDVLYALRQTSTGDRRWDLCASFMLQTGLRTQEVFGLTWRDVDLDNSRIHIHQVMTVTHGLRNRTKTGRERYVMLNATATKVLRQRLRHLDLKEFRVPEPDEFVFPWNRESFMSGFRSAMLRLVEQGVIKKRFRPYDLRHSHISVLLEKGIPVTQIGSWCGNNSQTIFKHYAATVSNYQLPEI